MDGRVRRLTRDAPPEAVLASWAPRGDWILFQTEAAEEDDFWTIRTDGSGLRDVGPGSGAAWSANGSEIALVNWGRTIKVLEPSGKRIRTLDLGRKVEAELGPSWSPDGKRLVIAANGRLLIVDSSGEKPPQPLGRFRGDAPIWSPDGKLIAFQRGEEGAVWVVRPDGTGARRIASGVENGFGWTADGSALVCNLGSPVGRGAAVLFRLAGGPPRRLGPGQSGLVTSGGRATSRFGDVSFSPDASRVVYGDAKGEFISRPDGSQRRYLTDSRADDSPAWSPDGSRIAFSRGSNPAEGGLVLTIGADGSAERRIAPGLSPQWTQDGSQLLVERGGGFHLLDARAGTDLGSFKGKEAQLSPNGRSVAFVRDAGDSSALYLAAANGSGTRALLRIGTPDLPRAFAHPIWSKDAKWIFIADYDPYEAFAEIRRVAVAGAGSAVVARSHNDGFGTLALSPSGDRLAFSTGPLPPSVLEILDLGTNERRRIPTPAAAWFTSIAWSPDGKRIAYSLAPDSDPEFRNDLYVADANGSNRKLISPPGQPVGGWAWRSG